mmetsp:Transcript_17298/g.57231  ORF Transcript_17298/g.57231 Transcript_17298/m.57231 type:complete len:120 (-) Transcript_17298:1680-2039(-)
MRKENTGYSGHSYSTQPYSPQRQPYQLERTNLDSFSATANPVTIRLLLIVARAKGWRIRCQDIPTAYLTAFLPTEVYIRTPKEFQEFKQRAKFLEEAMSRPSRIWLHAMYSRRLSLLVS